MEKIKVVHWKNVLGNDIDAFKLVLQHNQAMKKYGKSSIKIPDGALEMYHKKIWICEKEDWYKPRLDFNGNLIFMSIIPGNDFEGNAVSNSIIDARGKRREYIEKRDFEHTEYQEALEREYYDEDFPSEIDNVHSIVNNLAKTMEVSK